MQISIKAGALAVDNGPVTINVEIAAKIFGEHQS
jgi:hypothetical protein